MKILKPLLLGKNYRQAESTYFSLYFPGHFDTKNRELVVDTLVKYGKFIQRIHVTPERNFKDLDTTIDFLRFLHECLISVKHEENIGVDIHTGHGIDIETIKNEVCRLDLFLRKRMHPGMNVSIENVHKSGLTSKNDIKSLAKFVKDNGLSNMKITIDIADLAKSEGDVGDQTVTLIKELHLQKLSDVVNCIHAPLEYSKIIETEFGMLNFYNNIFLVTEGSWRK